MPDKTPLSNTRPPQESPRAKAPPGAAARSFKRSQAELQRREQRRLDRYGRFGGR